MQISMHSLGELYGGFLYANSAHSSSPTAKCYIAMPFQRIHITGNAGSGKSSLARKLGSLTGLPGFGLDKIVWKPGWKEAEPEEIQKAEISLTRKSAWIIEGVSHLIRDSADTIIFLDYPRQTCAWRCIKRNWRHLLSSRPELPANCPELFVIPKLTRIIWRFPQHVRPKILKEFGNPKIDKNYFRITDNDTLDKLVSEVKNTVQQYAQLG